MNELEGKLNQIAGNLLVQTKLVERFERRTEERCAEHEERMDRIETVVESLANECTKLQAVASVHGGRLDRIDRTLESVAEGHRSLQGALSGLVETIDRFIRGQLGDGRG